MTRRVESTAFVQGSQLLRAGRADVARIRARTRHRRITRLAVVLGALLGFLWFRYLTGDPIGLPHLPSGAEFWLPPLLLVVALGCWSSPWWRTPDPRTC